MRENISYTYNQLQNLYPWTSNVFLCETNSASKPFSKPEQFNNTQRLLIYKPYKPKWHGRRFKIADISLPEFKNQPYLLCRLTGTSIMLFSAQFQFNVVVASSSQATTLPRASILVQSTKRCMILPRPMGNENVTYPAGACTFFCLLMDSSFGRRKKIFYCQQEEILGMRIVGMLCLHVKYTTLYHTLHRVVFVPAFLLSLTQEVLLV